MARLIKYEDLALIIEPEGDTGSGYQVRLLGSPFGATAKAIIVPFRREELEWMIQEVADGLSWDSSSTDNSPPRQLRLSPKPSPARDFREIGARLFRALFRGRLGETYFLSRGRTDSMLDHGLRIRIVLPADNEDGALLQSLPWELLYDERARDFLARNVLTPVIRQLALPMSSAVLPETAASRLRILIVVASPAGVPDLEDGDERARILEAWCRREGAEVKVLLKATWRDLAEAVRSDHCHVVHFIAHGSFDEETGVGSLMLETKEGRPQFVPGHVLAETLRACRELRLVFLNSCETAQVGRRLGQDPLLGVSASLVQSGVPAVIAMQFPIFDSAAKIFSEAVYRSLARGSSLEAAVADGRLAMYQADPGSWEWITPVLLTGLSDAQVFRPLCLAEGEDTPSLGSILPRVPYQRLCGRDIWLGVILEQLRDPKGNPVIAIHGMGGIGKTALAHEVVRRSIREGLVDDLLLWEQAVRPVAGWIGSEVVPPIRMTFEEILDKILQHCGWTDGNSIRIEEKIRRAGALLRNRRAILVLDNMETAQEPQEEILRRLLPILAATPTRLIVTSRKRFEALVFSVELQGLEAGGAREFLLSEAHDRNIGAIYRSSDETLDRIALAVGGSPLAMKLVVGQLQFLPVQVVLTRLKDVRIHDGEGSDDEYASFYRYLFWASWLLLEGNEDAREILLLLSWYTPLQGAPWARLLEGSELRDEPKRFSDAIHSLWKLSFVEIARPTEKPDDVWCYLHPLTQTFVESMEA